MHCLQVAAAPAQQEPPVPPAQRELALPDQPGLPALPVYRVFPVVGAELRAQQAQQALLAQQEPPALRVRQAIQEPPARPGLQE